MLQMCVVSKGYGFCGAVCELHRHMLRQKSSLQTYLVHEGCESSGTGELHRHMLRQKYILQTCVVRRSCELSHINDVLGCLHLQLLRQISILQTYVVYARYLFGEAAHTEFLAIPQISLSEEEKRCCKHA